MVDYRDATGVRRWVTCATRREAEHILEKSLGEARQPIQPAVDPNITLDAYADHWLAQGAAHLKPSTLTIYTAALRLHLRPVFGRTRLRLLQRGAIKAFLAQKLVAGLSRGSVRILYATLRALLNAAIDDGVIAANPGARLGRYFRLVPSASTRQEEIKAMSRAQLEKLLETAAMRDPRWYPLWLCLARAGLRLGEALALEWRDLDFAAREIRVTRTLADGGPSTPKSGHGRTVDMSQQLADVLRRLRTERKAETLRRGWQAMPSLVFCSEAGTPLQVANVRRAFARALKYADLPDHFTPHSLRHTFASLLLQQGESPVYVQRQLGHASIQLTVDTYGRWLPMGNKAAVDRLDEQSGSKVVANAVAGARYRTRGGAQVHDSEVVRRGGFEPPTPCLKGRSSTWLS